MGDNTFVGGESRSRCKSQRLRGQLRRTTRASPIVAAWSIELVSYRFTAPYYHWLISGSMHRQNNSPPYLSAGRFLGGELFFKDLVMVDDGSSKGDQLRIDSIPFIVM